MEDSLKKAITTIIKVAEPDKANEWLQRAKSNMARTKSGRVSSDIFPHLRLQQA